MVAHYDSIWIVLAIVVIQNMDITQFDVKTIFPNGDILEEIFMDQLGGFQDMFNSFKAYQLNFFLWNVRQTSRVWNNKFDSFLIEYDLHPSAIDLCIYYNAKDHNLIIIVVVACNIHSYIIEDIIRYMGEPFQITTSGLDTHVGLHIVKDQINKIIFLD